jgi:hypothetical protein
MGPLLVMSMRWSMRCAGTAKQVGAVQFRGHPTPPCTVYSNFGVASSPRCTRTVHGGTRDSLVGHSGIDGARIQTLDGRCIFVLSLHAARVRPAIRRRRFYCQLPIWSGPGPHVCQSQSAMCEPARRGTAAGAGARTKEGRPPCKVLFAYIYTRM